MTDKPDADQQREVGWLITKDPSEDNYASNRQGWGQLRVHADETEASYERIIARTIFMDKSLTEHMIPEEARVCWRAFSDDMDPGYEGIVNVAWLMVMPGEEATGDDLAYNIDRFCMEDRGDIYVLYSREDILKCAQSFNQPTWERFAKGHPIMNDEKGVIAELADWLPIYG